MIKAIDDKCPVFGKDAHVAESADIVGNVTLGDRSSIWYGVVVRGDQAPISIGPGSNIQDNAVIHVSHRFSVSVGADVTVGHGAILHGCTVEDGVLIGMGAVLLDGCVVGAGAIVAAGALVTQGTVIPPRTLAMGSPAKVVRPLREEELASNRRNAEEYMHFSAQQLPPAE
jgi:carbonic anhydrase/acetyltransferase-like protein (isoleucine patch superfamily)